MALRIAGAALAVAAAGTLLAALALRSPHPQPVEPRHPTASTHTAAAQTVAVSQPASSPLTAARTASGRAATRDVEVETVFHAAWGDAPGQLGHTRPSEGAPEGPMSFAVDRAGRVHVLDQVNARIQVFEGAHATRQVPVPRSSFQDIAVDGQGGWILLDRLGTPALVFVAPDAAVREVPLVGRGVAEGGAVTALLARPDGVWVEVEHAEVVRVADAAGYADGARPRVQGRFAEAGASVQRALLAGRESVTVLTQEAGLQQLAPRLATRVSFQDPVLHIEALEADERGRTVLVADLVRGRPGDTAAGPPAETLEAVVLDASGAEVDRFRMATRGGHEEQFRAVRLGEDGSLYQLVCDDHGASLRRYGR